MKLKRLPIGIQSFHKLREGDYLYVDKTEYIYKLVTENDYIFFSFIFCIPIGSRFNFI